MLLNIVINVRLSINNKKDASMSSVSNVEYNNAIIVSAENIKNYNTKIMDWNLFINNLDALIVILNGKNLLKIEISRYKRKNKNKKNVRCSHCPWLIRVKNYLEWTNK